jgi:hypothetical protein
MAATGCNPTAGARASRASRYWPWFALSAAAFGLGVSGLLAGDHPSATPPPVIATTGAEAETAPKLAIAPAAPPTAAPAPAPSLRDMRLAVHVRSVLMEDGELAPYNLGVKVRGGVAVLWGPLPSVELQQRALKRAEEVQGVLSVRSEMYLATVKPAEQALTVPPTDDIIRSTSASPGSRGTLTARTLGTLVPFTSAQPGSPPDPPEPPPSSVALLAPVAVAPSPEPAGTGPNDDDVARLRRSNERFRLIQTERKGGVVVVRGGETPGEDVMAFARALANLPGVERVVLRSDP